MDYSKITLGELLSSENKAIKRNAIGILKQLQNHKELHDYRRFFCDNTDCPTPNIKKILTNVILNEDFNYEQVWWCGECIRRDKDMLNFSNQ